MSKRKTKYKAEYCDKLIDHMSKGYSITSFSAIIKVHRDTIYEWFKTYPDFAEARDMGYAASMYIWEKMGIDLATGMSKGSARVWEVNMYNRFRDEWKANVKEDDNGDKQITIKLKYDPLKDDEDDKNKKA